jgi:AraC family transcriptional regulator of adaptative response/methylated-DNA-[protein]-cysteine methyltransferase
MPASPDVHPAVAVLPSSAEPELSALAHTASPPTDDAMFAALAARDRRYDGTFVYAVRTTGVACRPSCGARTPRRENIVFFRALPEALAAGFRACKRCRPELHGGDDVHAAVVTAACRLLDAAVDAEQPIPPLEQLAQRTGYSPFHLHRLFTKATGLTPRAYATARRAARAAAELERGRSVSEAIVGAGYSSSSRFYERDAARLGMAPRARQRGGAGERIRWTVTSTTLGPLLVAATARGLCHVQFGDDPATLRARFPKADLGEGDAAFAQLVAQVASLVETPRAAAVNLPLDIRGTAFQERVWQALRRIAPGETLSYADLAARIGQPTAVRAVARACASNDLAVAIPCHRVIGRSGDLTGYRWGVEMKRALLARERAEGDHASD